MKLNIIEKYLLKLLRSIIVKLDQKTMLKYNRINPFTENLINWKTKGDKLFGKRNITIYDTSTIVGDVSIGENTWVGPYTALDGTGGLVIGKFCSISSKVNIISHDSVKWALSGGREAYQYKKIEIGDYCFIGTGSFIGRGVSIGKHSIVGAGSIVTKSFSSNSIIAGVPAKKIGEVELKEDGLINLIYYDKKTN